MRNKWFWGVIIAANLVLIASILADTITTGAATVTRARHGAMDRAIVAWTTSVVTGDFTATIEDMHGRLNRAVIVPSIVSGSMPNALWDVTIKDADGIDLLNSAALNINTSSAMNSPFAVTDAVTSTSLSPLNIGTLTVGITNAASGGRSAVGSITIYSERVPD